MYKFKSGQMSFSDFKQPIGMEMSPDNRWVKKAESIPWNEIEKRYAALFTNKKGNVAKSLRLGACIIQTEYGFSDEETVLQIQEGPYLQYFCGFSEFKYERPFDPSLMVYFRKRLTPKILGEINELIIGKAEVEKKDDDDDASNEGTLIVDATCATSKIHYPTDTSLLNEARENSEAIIDMLYYQALGEKPRTYRRKARKEYINFVRNRKPGYKKIRKCIKKQLGYLGRNLATIEKMQLEGSELSQRCNRRLETIKKVYEQQKGMYQDKTHKVENRIVSISQPYIRPIMRGKLKTPCEFGVKLDISVVNGYTRLETYSFNNYNEATLLQEVIERYKERTGKYPERVLADKIYRNRNNLQYCKGLGISLSGPALGRPKKDVARDRKQEYKDICERVEVERRISLAKRKCGMGLITTRLEKTTACVVALSILVLNLRKIQCTILRLLKNPISFLTLWKQYREIAFIQ